MTIFIITFLIRYDNEENYAYQDVVVFADTAEGAIVKAESSLNLGENERILGSIVQSKQITKEEVVFVGERY